MVHATSGTLLFDIFWHDEDIIDCCFGRTYEKIYLAGNQTISSWDLSGLSPAQLQANDSVLRWARAIAGLKIEDRGNFKPLPEKDRNEILNKPELPEHWELLRQRIFKASSQDAYN